MRFAFVNNLLTAGSSVLSPDEEQLVEKLIAKLNKKRLRNQLRQQYYDQKILLKSLRISLPPQMQNIGSVLGWPAKTVDVLADRINFQGFVSPDTQDDMHGLAELSAKNDFANEFSQAVTSALTHSVAFLTISRGVEAGEPEILWLARSAANATGIWNRRTRALSAGLTITGRDSDGRLTHATLYLPDRTVELTFRQDGTVRGDIQPNPTGRVLMEPLVYGADLSRDFGRSRITRTVMALTDSAIRTIVRSEVGAEFFAAPQRYLMGADEDAIDNKWSALMSRILTISKDEDGDTPTFGQFPQMSMQPHTDQLRQWAALLAAESSIPLDELGFPSDNPSSDSAIQSQRDPLRLRADNAIRGFQPALRRLAVTSVMLRDGHAPAELETVQGWFAPTVHISDAAAADAVLKQVQVMPWLAESPVILEKLGYSATTISRLLTDKQRSQSNQLLQELLAGEDGGAPGAVPASGEVSLAGL